MGKLVSRVAVISIGTLLVACQDQASHGNISSGTVQERTSPKSEQASASGIVVENGDFGMPLDSLAPEFRESLRNIKVFRLINDNIDEVWRLRDSGPEGIMMLDCDPGVLSTGRMEAIATWAKKGHGVFVQGSQLEMSSYLLPSPYYLEEYSSEGDWEWVEESTLLQRIDWLSNPLGCANQQPPEEPIVIPGTSSFRFRRAGSKLTRHDTTSLANEFVSNAAVIFENAREKFIPVIVTEDSGEVNYVLFASTFEGARVIWYSGRLDFARKDCHPEYDDAMLWVNLMHWLAAKDLPKGKDA